MVLAANGRADPSQPFRSREYGVARYSRMRAGDFQAADEYYQRTRTFWTSVLTDWHELFQSHSTVTLRAPVDQAGLFRKLFEYADQLAGEQTPPQSADAVIHESLADMGVADSAGAVAK